MAKIDPQLDVLVLGQHPSAYLAAALLRHKTRFNVLHATIPGEPAYERLVFVNPALFHLHPLLEPLKRKLPTAGVYGVRFLSDDSATASEHRNKAALTCISQLKDVRAAMEHIARAQDVPLVNPRQILVHSIDERGLSITLGNQRVHPKALVLAGPLTSEQHRTLGVPEEWDRGIVHRYTYARIRNTRLFELAARPLAPMSLDLDRRLYWAWVLPGERCVQLAVEQPVESIGQVSPLELMNRWTEVLHRHGVLTAPLPIASDMLESADLPFGGALAHEGLANRTLLIGPAGGFFSASGEDIYPNCWSAVYAADVLKKALKEPHLQDALQPYRQRWRTTLGDYLRGPQQNLRFLLPLVYRNQVMTSRLAEAILSGKSVVR